MKKQKRKVGAVVSIKVPNEQFAYARVLDKANYAIYDFFTTNEESDVKRITSSKILFIISVYDDAGISGRWTNIGFNELEQDLQSLPFKFIQDKLDPKLFYLYDPNTGKSTPSNFEVCKELERAAVWEPEHVEERIVDHLLNRPNIWVEKMKAKTISPKP